MGGGCCIGDCCVVDIPGAIEKILEFFCSSDCCLGYHPGRSDNEAHAKKIADELAEMKEKKHQLWSSNEQKLLSVINAEMMNLINELDSINQAKFGGKKLNINIEGIKVKAEELKEKVVGFVGRYFDDRLVLTDKELSVILEERDDEKRAKNFEAFCEKLQKNAIQGLKTAITETIQAQNSLVSQSVTTRLNEVNGIIQQEKEEYESLLKAKDKSEHDAMLLRMDHIYTHGLCDIILDQLR